MEPYVLSTLRVLDLSEGIAGAYCTKLLVDAGADCIKIEIPPRGPFAHVVRYTAHQRVHSVARSSATFTPPRRASRLTCSLRKIGQFHPRGSRHTPTSSSPRRSPAHWRRSGWVTRTSCRGMPPSSRYRSLPTATAVRGVGDRPTSSPFRQSAARLDLARCPRIPPFGGRSGRRMDRRLLRRSGRSGPRVRRPSVRAGRVRRRLDPRVHVGLFQPLSVPPRATLRRSAKSFAAAFEHTNEIRALEPTLDGWVGLTTVTGERQWKSFSTLIGRAESGGVDPGWPTSSPMEAQGGDFGSHRRVDQEAHGGRIPGARRSEPPHSRGAARQRDD